MHQSTSNEFFVTFGVQFATEKHPHYPTIHPDGYFVIEAFDEVTARSIAFALFGEGFARVVDLSDITGRFPLGELGRFALTAEAPALPDVVGFCPQCGTSNLFLSPVYSKVLCSNPHCTRRDAASLVLQEAETEHVIEVGADSFNLLHPLRERIEGDILKCDVHARVGVELGEVHVPPGRYRVDLDPGADVEPWLAFEVLS